jgi:hypothetical protein
MSSASVTRWVRWLGLTAVLGAAAVLSFHGMRDLALAVSIPIELAWLLPVAVDAGAAVSCACWLSRDLPADAVTFARTQTWLLLGGTVIGNAAQLGMHASWIAPPWWVAVLVGAIPPAVVGGTVHLAVLVGRPPKKEPADEQPPVLEQNSTDSATTPEPPPVARPALRIAPARVVAPTVQAHVEDDALARARELAAKGVGRPTIMKETGIKDGVAKALVREAKARA